MSDRVVKPVALEEAQRHHYLSDPDPMFSSDHQFVKSLLFSHFWQHPEILVPIGFLHIPGLYLLNF